MSPFPNSVAALRTGTLTFVVGWAMNISGILQLSPTAYGAQNPNADQKHPRVSPPEQQEVQRTATSPESSGVIRIGTFNCSLNREQSGQLQRDVQDLNAVQLLQVSAILRTVRPDIVLLNEIDFDANGISLRHFLENFLKARRAGLHGEPIDYAWHFAGPVNTGLPTGRDLNHNGRTDDPEDAHGFGRFAGQYGMAVLSRFPIDASSVRTFQQLLWKDMPDAALPIDPQSGTSWYSTADLEVLRLSSKSHWDVPVQIAGHTIHVLASHPTPPAFDGPEDRNGRRNHDEIRLWAEYLSDGDRAWLRDDRGQTGGLPASATFVVLGDLNADPSDGDSFQSAIHQLLRHPRINSWQIPSSSGARQAAEIQGRVNLRHKGLADYDTADFSDYSVGNLRVDYVLPGTDLLIRGGGVFWPEVGSPGAEWIGCSDHRLVWIDVRLP